MESIFRSPAFIIVGCATCLYLVVGAIYRLLLSPVARLPGPKLAALTFWYEFYYDVMCKGRYSWKIQELHEKYGPIVRINPEELHVADSTFYDAIYVGSSRRTDKWEFSARMFGTSLAAVGTTDHELHRLRRSGLNAFFSKRSISRLEPTVQQVVDHAIAMLEQQELRVVNLRNFFAAFSADVIGEVAFGGKYGLLDRDDFEPGWQRLMMDLSRATHLMKQFPWVYTIFTMIPQSFVSFAHPLTKRLFDIRKDIRLKIEEEKASIYRKSQQEADAKDDTGTEHSTVLHSLLNSELPSRQLLTPRLEDEAFTLLGAGTITTAHALVTIIYYVLSNPSIKSGLEREVSELYTSLPNHRARPGLKSLEQAPYLSGVISEGLRLSFGVSHRLPRISPDTALHYQGSMDGKEYDYTIPPGVPVSMTQMFIHLDPTIYASPHRFDPLRWITSSRDDEGRKEELIRMKHFLVPFSKGTRMCAGINLAYAELYLMLGALFAPDGMGRKMKLFKTSLEDVECVHDFFNPSPRLDSQGVRVVITRAAWEESSP